MTAATAVAATHFVCPLCVPQMLMEQAHDMPYEITEVRAKACMVMISCVRIIMLLVSSARGDVLAVYNTEYADNVCRQSICHFHPKQVSWPHQYKCNPLAYLARCKKHHWLELLHVHMFLSQIRCKTQFSTMLTKLLPRP